jgi:DNA-binding MarR family transcriptional regulator
MDDHLSSLLRRLHHEIRRRVLEEVRAHGYHDISQQHIYVFQRPGPDGCRPIDLARRTIVTKQAMNHLLVSLETNGYLRRMPAPHDRRATVVRLTPKGRKLTALIHATASRIEHEWAAQLGSTRMRELLESLSELDAIAQQTGDDAVS